jgi:hypothetical protein
LQLSGENRMKRLTIDDFKLTTFRD